MENRILEIALETVAEKVFYLRMLFANLDFDPTPENAAKCGLESYYKKYCEYQEIMAAIKMKLTENKEREKKHWRRIALVKNGNGFSLGAVYVCPYCDTKSTDDFRFCPNCGEYVGRGVEGGK